MATLIWCVDRIEVVLDSDVVVQRACFTNLRVLETGHCASLLLSASKSWPSSQYFQLCRWTAVVQRAFFTNLRVPETGNCASLLLSASKSWPSSQYFQLCRWTAVTSLQNSGTRAHQTASYPRRRFQVFHDARIVF